MDHGETRGILNLVGIIDIMCKSNICEEKQMRILHTSDWHLGKNLEGYSRMDEQEAFLNDFD